MSPFAMLFNRAFRGLTPEFLGICGIYVAFAAFGSWGMAAAFGRSWPFGEILEAFARSMVAEALRFSPFFAAIVVFNLASGRALVRVALALTVLAIGTTIAMHSTFAIDEPILQAVPFDRRQNLFAVWLSYLAIPALFAVILMVNSFASEWGIALERQRLDLLDLDRSLAQARLNVAQAQIEPHFLFNTLANIRHLYAVDPPEGKTMLRNFSAMLGHTLPKMRDTHSTLGQEIAHVTAYLSVQQIRMGKRLQFTFDVPEALLGLEFPPLMLLTLVENAIKHGIGPLKQGGSIKILGEQAGATLRVQVIDTGRGLKETSGPGIGLANIESRLRAYSPGRGRLTLEQNANGGVSATIDVPAPKSYR